MEKKFYKGYNDGMFKAVFCNPKDEDKLKWLIERSLKEKVEIIKVIPPEIIKPNIYVRNKTLDVLVKLKGKIVNIEMNSGYYNELHIRNSSYLFSKYSEEIKVGEEYYIMSDFIQINFTKGLSEEYPLVGTYTLTDVKTKINFIDNLKIYEFNIDKIFDECYNKNNKEFNFVAMLNSDEKQLKKICKGDIMMEEIENEIRRLNKDEEFTEFLSREEDVRKLTNTLLHHAKDDGIKEVQIKAAENLLSKGMKIEEIFQILKVENEKTKDEIKKMAKDVNKLNQDPEIIDIIIENEDEIIKNTLYEKGITQGIEQKAKETAKKMLKEKLDIDLISKITGLSKEEIEKLK